MKLCASPHLRMVAADAPTMRFGLRSSHVKRAALPDQILFGLFLPGAELGNAPNEVGAPRFPTPCGDIAI
jgi:hypothetical protein